MKKKMRLSIDLTKGNKMVSLLNELNKIGSWNEHGEFEYDERYEKELNSLFERYILNK